MFKEVLHIIASNERSVEHDPNDEGKMKDLRTWCLYPHKNHTTLDSDIFQILDKYTGKILDELEKYRQEVCLTYEE